MTIGVYVERRAISPSQIKTFLRCKRRWGFTYIDGIRPESNEYAEFGKEGHRQYEVWFKQGIPPNQHTKEGKVALSGIHHWPAPQLVHGVEFAISVETRKGLFKGFQDLGFHDPLTRDLVVGDHKFTGSFEWALKEAELRDDVQANIYALAAMERHRTDRLELRWVYYRRTGQPKSKKVSLVVLRDQVEKVFQETIDPAAEEIYFSYAHYTRGKDLPPNPHACDDFGGCGHRDRCEITTTERIRAIMAADTLKDRLLGHHGIPTPQNINPPEAGSSMSTPQYPPGTSPLDLMRMQAQGAAAGAPSPLDALRAQAQGQAAQPSLPQAAPPQAPAAPAAPAAPMSPLDLMRAQNAQPAAPMVAPQLPAAAAPAPQAAPQTAALPPAPAGFQWNAAGNGLVPIQPAPAAPPAAFPSPNQMAMDPLAAMRAMSGAAAPQMPAPAAPAAPNVLPQPPLANPPPGFQWVNGNLAPITPQNPAPAVLPTQPAQPQMPTSLLGMAQAGLGAQPGTAHPALNAQQAAALAATLPTGVTLEQATLLAQQATPRVFRLLINCRLVRPTSLSVHLAADICEKANAKVCEENNVSHYSLVDYKSRGAMVVAVHSVIDQMLKAGQIAEGDTIILFTSDKTEADCLDAFVAFSREIIRS